MQESHQIVLGTRSCHTAPTDPFPFPSVFFHAASRCTPWRTWGRGVLSPLGFLARDVLQARLEGGVLLLLCYSVNRQMLNRGSICVHQEHVFLKKLEAIALRGPQGCFLETYLQPAATSGQPWPGVCRMSGLRRRPPGEDTTTGCQQTSSNFCSGARLDVQKARDLEDAASPPQRCPPSMGSDPHRAFGHCRWKTEREVCFLTPRADTCVLGFGSRKKFVPAT